MDQEIKKQLDRIERFSLLAAKSILTVKDVANQVVTIDASSNMSNLIARDITVSEKSHSVYGAYKAIESSAFVSIHGIGTPLCYNRNGKY